jgi:O-succinylhomoserine sulfhydrylase
LRKTQMTRPGTMLSLELKGGQAAAFRFLNALELVTISNNLGDAKSIITHPATTTHQRLSEEARARWASRRGWCACRWDWRMRAT